MFYNIQLTLLYTEKIFYKKLTVKNVMHLFEAYATYKIMIYVSQ